MDEAFNSLYKWVLIHRPGEASMTSSSRPSSTSTGPTSAALHGEITNDNTYTTPAEFEALYYQQTKAA